MVKKALIYVFLACLTSGILGQTRTSVSAGSYATASNWDCNCVPSSTESIIISTGHTIFLPNNRTANNVEIKTGGILDNNGRRMDITGNYIVNGEHTGNGNIRLTGVNTTIDGSGIMSNSGDLEIRDGSKTILSTADLEKTTGGQVRIRGAFTITNQGIFRTTRNISGDNSSIWTNSSNAILEAGRALLNRGTLNASAIGNEVIYSRDGNQNIKTPSSSNYYNLTLSGTNIKSLGANINILGNLGIEGGTFNLGTRTVTLSGDYLNTGGVLNEGTSNFELNGIADQNLISLIQESFYNLRINKSSGHVILGVDIVIANIFTLNGGNIKAGNFTALLGTGTTSIGSLVRNSGYIEGTFGRWLSTTGTTYLFPIGSASTYHPANITFTNLTPGLLEFNFVNNAPGGTGLPISDGADSVRNAFIEGYWISTATSSLASTNFNLNLDATGFNSYTINPSTRIIRRSSSISNWVVEGNHVPAVNPVVFRTNLVSISSQFALGDTTGCLLPSPATSVIAGSISQCINTSGIGYSVLNTGGSTYNWEITGGIQAAGGISNNITVNWGSVGMTGEVKVTEYNGCEYGDPVSLAVDINPLPVDKITGTQNVEQFTTGYTYSVTASAGYTYNWTITGGNKTGGGTSSSITVDWGAKGVGIVSVTATNGCGTSIPVELLVNVFEYVRSVQSGNWGQSNRWDCACVPDETHNVIIEPTHNITLNANSSVGNLIINPTASLSTGNRRLSVYGLLINNGSVSGTGRFAKFGSYSLEGSGSWAGLTSSFRFDAGVHTVESDVNMVKSGDVEVRSNSVVINYGHIETSDDLSGSNATSIWYNDTTSILSVGLTLFNNNGKLVANAENNTVIYSRTGANNQNILVPDGSQYFNLTIDGDNVNSDKQVTGNLEILGDLNLVASTFDAAGSFVISLHGDWNNTGGTFDPITSSVVLVGNDQNINHNTEELFYNMQASTSGTKLLNTPVMVMNDLTIDNGVTFDVNSLDNNQLNVQGDIQNNGSLLLQKALLLLDGSAAQITDGSFTIYDVLANNGSGITINSGNVSLENSMELIGSTIFNTGGLLTFLSNSTQTAYIKELAAGNSVNGNVTVQRYLDEGIGYYMLGSPVTGSTLADWNGQITMTGFPGSNNPGWQFGSVYSYSESSRNGSGYTSGYQGATNITNALNPGEGWFVYLFNSPITTDVTGPLQQGTIGSGSLSFTAIGATSEQGWHLIANPYASPILWGDVTKTNIQSSEAYVRRADVGGNYWAVNGDGIDTIYSAEGFWVQAGLGGGSVTFDEADKIDALDDYNAKQQSSAFATLPIKMNLTYSGHPTYFDYSVLQFGDTNNTVNFDGSYGESRKIGSSVGTYPNIASFALADTSVVYYNSLNPNKSIDIPLKVWTLYPSSVNETYNLEFQGIETWTKNNHCLIITDSLLNQSKKLKTGDNAYQWMMMDTITEPRLFLNHTSPLSVAYESNTCYGSGDAFAKVKGSSNSHDYIWINALGDTLLRQVNHSGWSEFQNIPIGRYQVIVSNNGACGEMGIEITIEDGSPVISSFTYTSKVENPRALEFQNTSVDATSYIWNFGDGNQSTDSNPDHTYDDFGIYLVRLISIRGDCIDTSYQELMINPTSISDPKPSSIDNTNIYLSGEYIVVEASFKTKTALNVTLNNAIGQNVRQYTFAKSKSFRELIPKPIPKGLYMVTLHSDHSLETEKVIVK